jgi:menaquinone-dependent protoporphyrinogen IX oxidase
MSDILCIYYSRTGNTKQAMEEIAQALGAEIVELRDGVNRSGWQGWLRSGLDAMRKTVRPLRNFQTARPLEDYRLVIVGTPVWAGRCSSVVRSFLKAHGKRLKQAAYVIIRGSENRGEAVYEQMDRYVPCGHCAAVSLQAGSVGYAFWEEEFLRKTRELLEQQ